MMTKKWQPYPTYKDSGVEWLGAIPEHWENWKISHAFQKIGSGTTPSTNRYDYYDGDVPWINTSELRENIITDTSVKITNKALLDNSVLNLYSPGTLLIAMYGATIGRLGILGITACTNQACCALANPILLDTKFVFYWLWMRRNELIILSSGGGQPNINQEKIRSIKIPAPPLHEQQKIAEFLDQETSKIDKLITKKERLIELLKEKRTALISHAVTKGLNPDVPMKDSGVEWLGEVPEGWEVKRFRELYEIRKRIAGKLGYNILAITQQGIQIKDIDSGEGQLSMDYSKYQLVHQGEFAMNQMDLLTGFVDISKYEGVTSPDYRVFTLEDKDSVPEYHLFYLQMGYLNRLFYPFGHGAAHLGRWRLPTKAFREFVAPCPPKEEQEEIANYIFRSLERNNLIHNKVMSAIQLLKEYRTALISAAVTGKIDVREH
jgi:restriction endonuclease S subunit